MGAIGLERDGIVSYALEVHPFLTAAFCLGCAGLAGAAHAQASGAEKTAAEALFGEGKRLMEQGKFGEACPKFADSQRLDPGVGTLLNLARCYQKNGQTATAWSTYKEAAGAARSAGQTDRENIARRESAALELTLPKLTVTVSPETASLPNLEVRLDGAVLPKGLWGVPAPVDPGAHSIEARAAGKKPFAQRVQIAQRASSTVTIPVLGTGSSSDPSTESTGPAVTPATSASGDSHGSSSQRTIGLVVGSAGIVAMVAGGALALSAKSAYDGVSPQSCDVAGCDDAGFQTRNDARDKAGVATIIFGVGAAALVGGGVLFLTAPSSAGSASLSVGPAGFAFRSSF